MGMLVKVRERELVQLVLQASTLPACRDLLVVCSDSTTTVSRLLLAALRYKEHRDASDSRQCH